MALFVVTTVIGILNGLDLVEFDRNEILTHVHAGTLGWITLGIVASSFWLFRRGSMPLAVALGVSIPVYVAAFLSGSLPARAITGVVVLATIGWLLVWAWRAWLADRTLPGLAVVAGLTSFAHGALTGVLLQVQLATGASIFPGGADVIGAHASTMVFSYLILAAMGFIEWRVAGATRPSRAGVLQVLSLFLGGVILTATLLFLPDAVQQLAGLYLVVTIVGVAIFVARMMRRAVRVAWLAATPSRYVAASGVFVLVAVGIFLSVVATVVTNPEGELPFNVLVASDHAAFIGVITNLLFGITIAVAADRREFVAWADQIVFWTMNLGLLVFIVGLIAEATPLIRIGAPLMGGAILLGVLVVGTRLLRSHLESAIAERQIERA